MLFVWQGLWMKRLLLLAAVLFPVLALASLPLQATLQEMAASADHILVGTVVGVDMVDGDGKLLTDPNAMTWPGLPNVIRLQVRINKTLVSNAAIVPAQLAIPLDPFLHYRLGQIQEAHAGRQQAMLLMLKGPSFAPIKAGVFARPLADRAKALRLHAASRR
jgi:hypothetical protein